VTSEGGADWRLPDQPATRGSPKLRRFSQTVSVKWSRNRQKLMFDVILATSRHDRSSTIGEEKPDNSASTANPISYNASRIHLAQRFGEANG